MLKNTRIFTIITLAFINAGCNNPNGQVTFAENDLSSSTITPSLTPSPSVSYTPSINPEQSVNPSPSPTLIKPIPTLTPTPVMPSITPSPVIQPDFKLNALYPMRILSIMNVDGSEQKDLLRIDNLTKFTLSPDDSKILFISSKDNGIYVMNADGTQLKKLETADYREEFSVDERVQLPEWFNDSKNILMTKGSTIYSVNIDTAEKTKITDLYKAEGSKLPMGFAYAFPSPDSKKVFFTENNNGYKTYMINIDGTGKVAVPGGGGPVKWSRDGKKFATYNVLLRDPLYASRGISVYDIESKKVFSNKYVAADFDWTPDGKIIYSNRAGDFENEIVDSINIVNYDGTDNQQLSTVVSNKKVSGRVIAPTSFSVSSISGKVAVVMNHCWTHGKNGEITYYSDEDAIYTGGMNFALHIYTMNLDGSDRKYLNANNGFYTLYPKWSNNGKKILFTHNILPRDYFSAVTVAKNYFTSPYIVPGFFTNVKYAN